MAFFPKTWQVGETITDAEINRMEQGIDDAHDHIADEANPHAVTAFQAGVLSARVESSGTIIYGSAGLSGANPEMGKYEISHPYGSAAAYNAVVSTHNDLTVASVSISANIAYVNIRSLQDNGYVNVDFSIVIVPFA